MPSTRLTRFLYLAVLASVVAGCSNDPAAPSSATVTTTVTKTATTSVSTAPGTPTTSEGGTSPGAPPLRAQPEPLPAQPEPGTLTLSSFFRPSQWEESQYNVANLKNVAGISTTVSGCAGWGEQTLELRLGSSYELLKFSIGQAQDSFSSSSVIAVKVLADSRQVDIEKVPFSKVQEFSENVTGVSALKIVFEGDTEQDCDDVGVVLFRGTLS